MSNPYEGDPRYEEIKEWTILDFDLIWDNKPEAATLTFGQYVGWVLAYEDQMLGAVSKALEPLEITIDREPRQRLDVNTLEDHFKDVDELTLEELEAAEPNPHGPFYDYGAARFFAQWFVENAKGGWLSVLAESLSREAWIELLRSPSGVRERRSEAWKSSTPDDSVAGHA